MDLATFNNQQKMFSGAGGGGWGGECCCLVTLRLSLELCSNNQDVDLCLWNASFLC